MYLETQDVWCNPQNILIGWMIDFTSFDCFEDFFQCNFIVYQIYLTAYQIHLIAWQIYLIAWQIYPNRIWLVWRFIQAHLINAKIATSKHCLLFWSGWYVHDGYLLSDMMVKFVIYFQTLSQLKSSASLKYAEKWYQARNLVLSNSLPNLANLADKIFFISGQLFC